MLMLPEVVQPRFGVIVPHSRVFTRSSTKFVKKNKAKPTDLLSTGLVSSMSLKGL